jgi:hypothetical protein
MERGCLVGRHGGFESAAAFRPIKTAAVSLEGRPPIRQAHGMLVDR